MSERTGEQVANAVLRDNAVPLLALVVALRDALPDAERAAWQDGEGREQDPLYFAYCVRRRVLAQLAEQADDLGVTVPYGTMASVKMTVDATGHVFWLQRPDEPMIPGGAQGQPRPATTYGMRRFERANSHPQLAGLENCWENAVSFYVLWDAHELLDLNLRLVARYGDGVHDRDMFDFTEATLLALTRVDEVLPSSGDVIDFADGTRRGDLAGDLDLRSESTDGDDDVAVGE